MDWSIFLGGAFIGFVFALVLDAIRGYLASRPGKRDTTVSDLSVLLMGALEDMSYMLAHAANKEKEDEDDEHTTEMDNDQPLVFNEEDHRLER